MAATPDGQGYWLVGANGSVYSFGDAVFYGPARPLSLPEPIVGFARTPDGRGYWMVSSHGAVYAFGDARYFGSLGATNLHNIPVVAIAPSFDGPATGWYRAGERSWPTGTPRGWEGCEATRRWTGSR